MSDPEYTSLEQALVELERVSPTTPLLALGQTIFWDEPMKAGVLLKMRKLGIDRPFVAGIHDSDYFAKFPGGKGGKNRFKTLPHNDTSTRGLWSAAGEFSTLFGSETVITRDMLASAGVRVDTVVKQRPRFLDEVTEAWGWRGIVSLDERPPVTSELSLEGLYPELLSAFKWATDRTLDCLGEQGRALAKQSLAILNKKFDEAAAVPGVTLAQFYRALLPTLYEFVSNASLKFETTTTTELLKFNRHTHHLPRFELLELFVNSATRHSAVKCYDDAIKGSPGLYELSRFGTGSIPFDMIVPGKGRGTIRLGNRGAVVMTPDRQFLSFKKPLSSLAELAEAVESKFGSECAIVGKAVSLIGMLAREFVFVFHEGASGYIQYSRKMHQLIENRLDHKLPMNPLLRVRYAAWDSLGVCCSWLKLPEIIQRPFGTEELCAPSFAGRWREVYREQQDALKTLGEIKRPIELIRYLDKTLQGSWRKLAEEYESLYGRLEVLRDRLKVLEEERDCLYLKLRRLKQERVQAEVARGEQFRRDIFDKAPSESAALEREKLTQNLESHLQGIRQVKDEFRRVRKNQHILADDQEVKTIHERRRSIELEAELKRTRLVRSAIVASKGLAQASLRPCAWWFPLVCPDGLWFRETVESSVAYLEPLT
jgi:hypothetical protein